MISIRSPKMSSISILPNSKNHLSKCSNPIKVPKKTSKSINRSSKLRIDKTKGKKILGKTSITRTALVLRPLKKAITVLLPFSSKIQTLLKKPRWKSFRKRLSKFKILKSSISQIVRKVLKWQKIYSKLTRKMINSRMIISPITSTCYWIN